MHERKILSITRRQSLKQWEIAFSFLFFFFKFSVPCYWAKDFNERQDCQHSNWLLVMFHLQDILWRGCHNQRKSRCVLQKGEPVKTPARPKQHKITLQYVGCCDWPCMGHVHEEFLFILFWSNTDRETIYDFFFQKESQRCFLFEDQCSKCRS